MFHGWAVGLSIDIAYLANRHTTSVPSPYAELWPLTLAVPPPIPVCAVKGHYEYLLCNTADLDNPDGVVTEDCLNQYPLNRVYDGPEDSPVDPDFPGRYYADAGCLHAERDQTDLFPPGAPRGHINVQKYQLPAGLTCEHCVLRMTWCE